MNHHPEHSRDPLKAPQAAAAGSGSVARAYLRFTWAFLRRPGRIGAICPSSRWLAEAMIAGADLGRAGVVVELGPGTGAFTEAIRRRLSRREGYLGIELDGASTAYLRARFPDLRFYEDSAERIGYYLGQLGWPQADYVISGLPFANMPAAIQRRIMEGVAAVLAPRGRFTTFAYFGGHWTAKGRAYRQLLDELFASVDRRGPVVRNLPPAFVYGCSQTRAPRPVAD